MEATAFKTSLEEWKHVSSAMSVKLQTAFKTSLEEWKQSSF